MSAPLKTTLVFSRAIRITLRDLLYAALVQSDNIAAFTLAHHVGSKIESIAPGQSSKYTPVDAFVAQMNALAKQLKMERTRFVNPHGVDYKVRPLPLFDSGRHGASDSLRNEQSQLPLLCVAKGTPNLVRSGRASIELHAS